MNIKEAVEWSKENDSCISIVGDPTNSRYAIKEGKLGEFHTSGPCTSSWSPLTYDQLTADWQPWQEPREYFNFVEAMVKVHEGNIMQCEDDQNLCWTYKTTECGVLIYVRDGGMWGGIGVVCADLVRSQKWYVVK